MKLQEGDIYLDTLSREDCKTLWNDFEYDFDHPTEELNLGHSDEKANEWFDEIQKLQGNSNVRLGIFKNDGTVIGDVALQNIDRINRKCSIGMGIAKIENRSKGYGYQAAMLIMNYGFKYLKGLKPILWTLISGRRSLLKNAGSLWRAEKESRFISTGKCMTD